MIKTISSFLLGGLVSAYFVVNHFTNIINHKDEVITNLNKIDLNIYRYTYGEEAEKALKINNATISMLMENELNIQNETAAQAIVISSLLLLTMTEQSWSLEKNVFLNMTLFYKKTKGEDALKQNIDLFKEQCEKYMILENCTYEDLRKIWVLIK